MNSRIGIESAEDACSPWRSPAMPAFIPVARQEFPSVKQPPGTHSPWPLQPIRKPSNPGKQDTPLLPGRRL